VVATAYLLGVSTRRVEKLVEQLGIAALSKSQVSEMAAHLDAQVEAFRNRPLDAPHYTFVWMDALVVKTREHGRTVNVHVLVAVASTPTAAARSSVSRSPPTRTAPAGWRSYAA
jgi:putative transposase